MAAHKSPITCHVLDSSLGKPAKGIAVSLQRHRNISEEGSIFSFDPIAHGTTDDDGRCLDLLTPTHESVEDLAVLRPGFYKIIFRTKHYFEDLGRQCFYPWVEITFEIQNPEQHYHIPLLLSPYSFTTYRGS